MVERLLGDVDEAKEAVAAAREAQQARQGGHEQQDRQSDLSEQLKAVAEVVDDAKKASATAKPAARRTL